MYETSQLRKRVSIDRKCGSVDLGIWKTVHKPTEIMETKVKKSHVHRNPDRTVTEIHYFKYNKTGEISDFKF